MKKFVEVCGYAGTVALIIFIVSTIMLVVSIAFDHSASTSTSTAAPERDDIVYNVVVGGSTTKKVLGMVVNYYMTSEDERCYVEIDFTPLPEWGMGNSIRKIEARDVRACNHYAGSKMLVGYTADGGLDIDFETRNVMRFEVKAK